MTPSQSSEQVSIESIVHELKRKFSHPHFEDWRVVYTYDGMERVILARVSVAGVTSVSRHVFVAKAPYPLYDRLLAAVTAVGGKGIYSTEQITEQRIMEELKRRLPDWKDSSKELLAAITALPLPAPQVTRKVACNKCGRTVDLSQFVLQPTAMAVEESEWLERFAAWYASEEAKTYKIGTVKKLRGIIARLRHLAALEPIAERMHCFLSGYSHEANCKCDRCALDVDYTAWKARQAKEWL